MFNNRVPGFRLPAALRACLLLLGLLPMTALAQTPTPDTASDIQLIAVQVTLDLEDYWTREAFERKIREQMDAVQAAADPDLPTLVVFPEDIGLMLVVQGMETRLDGIESIEEAIGTVVRANAVPLMWTRLIRWKSWVPALLLNRNQQIAETYFEVFSAAARDYGYHIVAGTAPLPPYRIEDGVVNWRAGPTEHNVYNTAYLFGPDGLAIGSQDKVDLIELEREAALDLKAGTVESLRVFDTAVGRIGLAICLDAFSDDVVDRLAELGAQILVQPSANPGPWNDWQQEDWLRSSHARVAVEQRFPYAINPMLNGPLWDIAFYGQSAIVASADAEASLGYSLLGPAGGFITMAASDDTEEVLVALVPHPDTLD